MIVAITTFQQPGPISREEAKSVFMSTAAKYQGVPGLVSKRYILSEDGSTVGGIHLWASRVEAEAMYTDNWRAFVREKYSTEPSVTYFDSPLVVDNVANVIRSDG